MKANHTTWRLGSEGMLEAVSIDTEFGVVDIDLKEILQADLDAVVLIPGVTGPTTPWKMTLTMKFGVGSATFTQRGPKHEQP